MAMVWNASQTRQEDIRFVGRLVKDGVVKAAEFVRERVQEERRGRAERGAAGVRV